MPPSYDEFGSLSLEEMFPDLDDGSMPEIEAKGDFSGGLLHCSAPAKFTDTHLVALLTCYRCANCQSAQSVGTSYAVRRVHHSRNQCIEFQTILPEMFKFFDDLPRAYKSYDISVPFCLKCLDDQFLPINTDNL